MRTKPRMRVAVGGLWAAAAAAGVLAGATAPAGCRRADPAARDLAAAVCDLLFRCCARGEIDYYVGPFVTDANNCADRLVSAAEQSPVSVLSLGAFGGATVVLPNLAALDRAVRDGRARIDKSALHECLAYLDGLACNTPPPPPVPPPDGCVPPPPPPPPGPCDPEALIVGRVGDGGPCSSPGNTLECKPGLVCRAVDALGVEGACVAPGREGDFCYSSAECEEELYCSLLDGTCQVGQAEGQPCLYADETDPAPPPSTLLIACADTLSCDPVTDTCVAACGRGASCFFDGMCDDTQGLVCVVDRCDVPRTLGLPCSEDADCEPALHCGTDPLDPFSLACVPRLADGQPCSAFVGGGECLSGFCDPSTNLCAPTAPLGDPCPSGNDAECTDGHCDTTFIPCTVAADCTPGSGVCNAFGSCDFVCAPLLPDGSPCTSFAQCVSDECVAGFCRTLPLADGLACDFDFDCESVFCNFDTPRVCAALPLALGEQCSFGDQCASEVCWFDPALGESTCVAGLAAGTPCGDPLDQPCGADLFCDPGAMPPVCTVVHETGEPCDSSVQCRGFCDTRYGRSMCDATPAPGLAVCDAL